MVGRYLMNLPDYEHFEKMSTEIDRLPAKERSAARADLTLKKLRWMAEAMNVLLVREGLEPTDLSSLNFDSSMASGAPQN